MSPTDILAALTWRDALDLGLLWIVVYAALRLLRGTRAVPVLLAVALVAAMAFVARALDLVAVAVLLKYFLEYVIIILIVVFHQELRRMLMRVGQRLLPTARAQAAESAVGKLVTAIDRLARAHVGALFILEGEIDVLAVCSDTGVEMDHSIDADTLVALSVPHPANRVHDGAILIREFKIARAGLICPLSDLPLDPRFGTRHRGAAGVSEETDSLVAVVSEERGEVRVVEGGVFSDPLKAEELEARIYAWIDRPPPEKQPTGSRADMSAAELAAAMEEGGASQSSSHSRSPASGEAT